MMASGPIFVGGLGRSGKTWLRFILTSHPNIAMSRRTNLWTQFHNRFGPLHQAENFERCLRALLHTKHVQLLNPDPARLRREFWQGEATYARLFALLHAHYAEAQGKPRWGDQTELLEQCADQLFAAYPDAKVIQMIRDPRDRYAATLARSPKDRGRVGGATARWLYSARLAERNLRRYPGRYLVVCYEALVSQPEKTVRDLCAFLDEEFMPEMLLMRDVPRFSEYSGTGRTPLSTAHIGSYRGIVPAREIAFMQLLAGRALHKHGYATHPFDLSPVDWLKFSAMEFPTNLVRAVAWRALAAGQYGTA